MTEANYEGIYEELRKVYGEGKETEIHNLPKYYKLELGDRIIKWNSKLIAMEFTYKKNSGDCKISMMSVLLNDKVTHEF